MLRRFNPMSLPGVWLAKLSNFRSNDKGDFLDVEINQMPVEVHLQPPAFRYPAQHTAYAHTLHKKRMQRPTPVQVLRVKSQLGIVYPAFQPPVAPLNVSAKIGQ